MKNLPDVPGHAGIGALSLSLSPSLSLFQVFKVFPSPISLTTTRLCRQTASNLSSYSLSHDIKICTHNLVLLTIAFESVRFRTSHFVAYAASHFVPNPPLNVIIERSVKNEKVFNVLFLVSDVKMVPY